MKLAEVSITKPFNEQASCPCMVPGRISALLDLPKKFCNSLQDLLCVGQEAANMLSMLDV